MKIDPTIFKAYDIRGLYPEQVTAEMAYHLGRAVSTWLYPEQVIVGRDMRISSQAMYRNLISGFLESAVDVVDIGLTSTDVFYHACSEIESPGVMVTASHNPPNYGGFKIVKELPYILGKDEGLEEIYNLILREDYLDKSKKGKLTNTDFSGSFVNKVLSLIKANSVKKINVFNQLKISNLC